MDFQGITRKIKGNNLTAEHFAITIREISMRLKLLPLITRLLYPVRWYIRNVSYPRGKGFLIYKIIVPLLPPQPECFTHTLPCGGSVRLQFREDLGIVAWSWGGYEEAELNYIANTVRPGATVIDVGANIGIFTISLAVAVGENGRVWSFEPLMENLKRLKENINLNGSKNIDLFPVGLGDFCGELDMYLSNDLAYASTTRLVNKQISVETRKIEIRRLDDLWQEAERPQVDFIKIDVEGSEINVLHGAKKLITTCKPRIIIEAHNSRQLQILSEFFKEIDYSSHQPDGFDSWNYLFSPC